MSSASIGRRVEHVIRADLERHGYYVQRSAASKGVLDLIAIGDREVLCIQVKRSGACPPAERRAVIAVADRLGTVGVPIIASKPQRQSITYRVLTGPGPHDWIPYEPTNLSGRTLWLL